MERPRWRPMHTLLALVMVAGLFTLASWAKHAGEEYRPNATQAAELTELRWQVNASPMHGCNPRVENATKYGPITDETARLTCWTLHGRGIGGFHHVEIHGDYATIDPDKGAEFLAELIVKDEKGMILCDESTGRGQDMEQAIAKATGRIVVVKTCSELHHHWPGKGLSPETLEWIEP